MRVEHSLWQRWQTQSIWYIYIEREIDIDIYVCLCVCVSVCVYVCVCRGWTSANPNIAAHWIDHLLTYLRLVPDICIAKNNNCCFPIDVCLTVSMFHDTYCKKNSGALKITIVADSHVCFYTKYLTNVYAPPNLNVSYHCNMWYSRNL